MADITRPLARTFRRRLFRWASGHSRTFSWRKKDAEPLAILIAEMLLRKTRAESVDAVLPSLLEKYPTAEALAAAPLADLESLLRPLGLFRMRSRAIRDVARQILENYGGCVPATKEDLCSLPHVGRYTANAVLCFAFGARAPIVDANIVRFFHRAFAQPVPVEVHKAGALWDLARSLLPPKRVKEFNWALLDFTASVCAPRSPNCADCPFTGMCAYYNSSAPASTSS